MESCSIVQDATGTKRVAFDYCLVQNELRYYLDELDIFQNAISEIMAAVKGNYSLAKAMQFKSQIIKQRTVIIDFREELKQGLYKVRSLQNTGFHAPGIRNRKHLAQQLPVLREQQNQLKTAFCEYMAQSLN